MISVHGYLGCAVSFGDDDCLTAAKKLNRVDYDTMIGTGLSGSLVVPVLAKFLSKQWAIIRKDGEGQHMPEAFVGDIGERWLFVDDFVSTGATLRRVHRTVGKICQQKHHTTTFVGRYDYDTTSYNRQRFYPAEACCCILGLCKPKIDGSVPADQDCHWEWT